MFFGRSLWRELRKASEMPCMGNKSSVALHGLVVWRMWCPWCADALRMEVSDASAALWSEAEQQQDSSHNTSAVEPHLATSVATWAPFSLALLLQESIPPSAFWSFQEKDYWVLISMTWLLSRRRSEIFFSFFFFYFRAVLRAHGSFQATVSIRATSAFPCHSHSDAGYEPHLRTTPQVMATPDP